MRKITSFKDLIPTNAVQPAKPVEVTLTNKHGSKHILDLSADKIKLIPIAREITHV